MCRFRIDASVAVAVVIAGLAPRPAPGQDVPTLLYEGRGVEAVRDALYEECYDAAMAGEAGEDGGLVCSASIDADARWPEGRAVASVQDGLVRLRVRFALAERTRGVRVWAYPWIEIEDAGGVVLEEDVRSEAYLSRVQNVLERVAAVLARGSEGREPWAERYESEHAWRLAAHLESVEHCDRTLDELTRMRVDRLLEQAGVQPRGRTLRDHCEELYEPVYLWGLARGIAEPTVAGYVEYRDSLPRVQRCTGQLALEARCP